MTKTSLIIKKKTFNWGFAGSEVCPLSSWSGAWWQVHRLDAREVAESYNADPQAMFLHCIPKISMLIWEHVVSLDVYTLWAFVCQCVVCVYNVCSICSCMLPWACVSISITRYLCVLQCTYTLWLSLIFPCVLFPVSSGSHHQGQGYVHPSSVCLCLSGDVYAIPMLFSLRDTVDAGDSSRQEHCSKENFYF